mmetsp:Transcript_43352/g.64272  ORF Transcript_43352/g.64272 Transcript_43352/m.64272 type:complete len:80 (+) Transcript_43352:74-313(+)
MIVSQNSVTPSGMFNESSVDTSATILTATAFGDRCASSNTLAALPEIAQCSVLAFTDLPIQSLFKKEIERLTRLAQKKR